MSDNEIVIGAGGKPGSYRGAPGVYAGTLVTHTIEGPFPAKQPKFEGETYRLHEWGFALEDMPEDGNMVWVVSGASSAGPKSKTFGIISALFDGREPPTGTKLDIPTHLIGRMALLDVRENDRGYPEVVTVTPLPKAMQPKSQTPAPVAAAAADASLPF